MTRIAICGDSFSDITSRRTCIGRFEEGWSWVHGLQEHYEIDCYAHSGVSNLLIYDQVKQAKKTNSIIVTNVSSIARVTQMIDFKHPDISEDEIKKHNKKFAQWIAKNSDVCWTPFPGYESISEIDLITLEKENELYNKELQSQTTKHHLTLKGNQILFSIIFEKIEGVLNERSKHTVS